MEPLAEKALRAVEKGELTIMPERFEKVCKIKTNSLSCLSAFDSYVDQLDLLSCLLKLTLSEPSIPVVSDLCKVAILLDISFSMWPILSSITM